MKLYSGPLSLFARKVEIALGEKGLAVEREMVAFSQAEGYRPKHPEVLAANPKGQVPVLVDGDLRLFDSTVILEYLEDAYPAPPLYPAEPAARARCRLLELEADEILLTPVRALMHRPEPWPPGRTGLEALEAEARKAEATIAAQLARLETRLAGRDFLCGAFSVADIAVFMVLLYGQRLGGPPLDPHPALSAWFRRLLARPAFARAVEESAEADRRLSRPVPGAWGGRGAPPTG